MKCLKLIPFVFCLWLSSLQAYANSLHDAASEPCDLKALKKEMGAAYPEDFMSVAFDKPPYDRVYKQDISPAVLRPSFQGLLIANDSILDYIDIENFKIRTTPRGWITHFNSADIPSLRDRIKENYPDGLKTFHRYDETIGNDTLYGDAGNDFLIGESGADALYGDAGDDELEGGTGNDVLNGGENADYLVGGSPERPLVQHQQCHRRIG